MSNNAYLDIQLNNTEWYDLGSSWHLNNSFGWESDGIRGHLFVNQDESLVVIGIKGTSAGLWTGGPTGEKDKINDNMLFSCCCARISRAWSPVCDCYQGNEYKCESSCLQKKISEAELYYDNALAIFRDVSDTYKNSTIWLTGHSLGGAIASLVGITFGIPTVTFEIPGDKLASERLHLPKPPGADLPLWHFGHTADPIFVGVCNGPSSSCWYGGYAMETRCHTGKVCVWDTVKDNGWRVDIRSHRVRDVIDSILMKPDDFPLPNCEAEKDCQDCGLWEFYDDRDPLETGTTGLPTSTTDAVTSTTDAATTTTATTDTQPSTTIHEPPTDPWPN
ncbi:Alpha/Beta hydrolase protein [Thamnidium elegans]|nr:Alpha/Beta hydrolase protein [Thamnidium elegans]